MTSNNSTKTIIYILSLSCVMTITFAFGRYLFSQLTPQIVETFHLNYEFIGRINFYNQGFYLLFSVIGGILSAKIGARILIYCATLLCAISIFSISFVTNKNILLILVSIQGIFTALSWIPMVELISRSIPEKNRGLSLGVISSGTSYGIILSGFLTPKLLKTYDCMMVWRFFGSISLIASIICIYIIHTYNKNKYKNNSIKNNTNAELSVSRPEIYIYSKQKFFLILLLIITGLFLVPYQMYLTPFIESDLGGNSHISGYCWAILGIFGLLSGFIGGYIADKFSTKKAMIIAYSLSIFSLLFIVAFNNIFFIYLSCIIFGLIYNAIFGFHPTYISHIIPPEKTAKFFGILNLALGLGAMLGSYITGYIKEITSSFFASYWMMLFLAIISVIICFMLKDDREKIKL